MSLSATQRRRISTEFYENLRRSGLRHEEVEQDLSFTRRRLNATLRMSVRADPVDVWLLRDYLEQAVADLGREPVEPQILTEQSRPLARAWYRLREAPRHSFTLSNEDGSL